MKTKKMTPPASQKPVWMSWNIWNRPTGVDSTAWKVPATTTSSTRSNWPAGRIQVKMVHTTMMAKSRA